MFSRAWSSALKAVLALLWVLHAKGQTYTVSNYVGASNPITLCFAQDTGDIYYLNFHAGTLHKVTPALTVTQVVSGFTYLRNINCDPGGTVYWAAPYYMSQFLYSYNSGTTAVLAGSGTQGFLDGVGTAAWISREAYTALDNENGYLYFVAAFLSPSRLRRMNLQTKQVETYIGNFQWTTSTPFGSGLSFPIVGDYPHLVYDIENNIFYTKQDWAIVKIDSSGGLSNVAGRTTAGNIDGTGSNAAFQYDQGQMVFDPVSGNLYVSDRGNNIIRKIDPRTRQVTTIATGMSEPMGLALDKYGDLYVGDFYNGMIKKIAICQVGGTYDATSKYCKYTSCSTGYQLSFATGRCDKCAANKYKSSSGTAACLECPGGLKAVYNRTACQPCVSGKYLSPTYTCVDCPVNSDCQVSLWSCFPGFRYNSTINTCEECPSNQVFNSTINACQVCNPNTYFASKTLGCLSCPTNAACNDIGFTCNPGYTLNSTTTGCSICPYGYFKSLTGNGACSTCPIGKQSSPDATSCVDCPAGKYRPDIVINTCISCPAFSVCSTTAIVSCQSGYKINAAGDGCEVCPAGHQSSADSLSCVSCVSGSTYITSIFSTCQSCPANSACSTTGFTCNSGYTLNVAGAGCDQCPLGYSKSSPGNGACSQCSVGTESAYDKQSCVVCSSGYYRSNTANSICIPCPFGATCSASAITRCANGYKVNSAGDNCEQCQIGYHSTDGVNCILCPSGSAKPSQDYVTCFTCPSGGTCSGSNVNCQNGYFFDGNVQCKRNDTYFSLMQTSTTASAATLSVTVTQTSTSLINNFYTQSITMNNNNNAGQQTQVSVQTVTLSQTITVLVSPDSTSQSLLQQSANSVTIDFIGTLPISPLILAIASFGIGLFIMLIISLVCFRKSPQRRKDEDFDAVTGMTATNTQSQRTFTNSTVR